MDGSKQAPSSSSLRRTPARKRRSNTADCDRQTQPRAEFRGERRDPYYVSYHGSYDPVNMPPKGFKVDRPSTREQPYAVREIPPYIQSPSSGPVTGFDESVRARNMPIVFIKQMRDKALFIKTEKGFPFYATAYDMLFKDFNNFYVEAKNRPQIGCIPTFNWTDDQVRIWSTLAKHIGVQYSGKREYSFPKGCLGKTIHGSYYSVNKPWPRFSGPDTEGREIFPFMTKPRSGRRSSLSRQFRSIKRSAKKAVVKPLDFSTLLTERRCKSRKEINLLWYQSDRSLSITEFRNSFPKILSLNTKKPLQVSAIVKDSLKKLGRRVSKFVPDLPWLQPKKLEYTVSFRQPQNRVRSGRLNVWVSADGNLYLNHANISNIHIVDISKRDAVRLKVENLQKKIDLEEDQGGYQGPYTLGGWDDSSSGAE